MFRNNNHSRKGQPIDVVDADGQVHHAATIAAARERTGVSPPKIVANLDSANGVHARGQTKLWWFRRAVNGAGPLPPKARPSAALVLATASTPFDAAIAALEGELQTLKAARDILAARGV